MKPTWATGKSSSYHSKWPVETINSASTSSSQVNDEVVVAQVTASPAKCQKVIPRKKILILKMPAECVI